MTIHQRSTMYAVAGVLVVIAIVALLYTQYPEVFPFPTPTPTPTNPYPTPTPTFPVQGSILGTAKIRIYIYYTSAGIPPAVIEQTGTFSAHELSIWNDIYPVDYVLFEVVGTLESNGVISDWQTVTAQKIEIYKSGSATPLFSSTGPDVPVTYGSDWQNGESKTLSSVSISSFTIDDLVAQYGEQPWTLQCNVTVQLSAHVNGQYQNYEALTPHVSFPFTYISPNWWDLGIINNVESSW